MAKRKNIDARLAALEALRETRDSSATRAALTDALEHGEAILAMKAAQIAGTLGQTELSDTLVDAFARFMNDPLTTDKGCLAKSAIASALKVLEHEDNSVYLAGVQHLQPEPGYGGPTDTAVGLRCTCVAALVENGYRDVLVEIAMLLADREAPVRMAAAQACAATESPEGVPLLRLKLLVGDEEPEVSHACCSGLLALDERASLDFIVKRLQSRDPDEYGPAALALGESRSDRAYDALRSWYDDAVLHEQRTAALTAIALINRDPAMTFLFDTLKSGAAHDAREVLHALSIYRPDEVLRERALKTLESRGDTALVALVEKLL